MRLEKRLVPFAIVVGLYMLAALGMALLQWNTEFLFYGLAMFGQIACVVWLDRTAKLPSWILWGLVLWGLVHLLGGTVKIPESVADSDTGALTLYNLRLAPWLPRYDQTVHTYGFLMASLAAWCGLRTLFKPTAGAVGVWTAVWLCGMGLGATNEVIEFAATRLMTWTNVGGYVNTGWDLVCNMLGAGLGGLWAVRDWKRRRA